MALKARVLTAGIEGEDPEVEEIELPPEALWRQLDNSGNAPADPTPAPTASPHVVEDPPEIARLDFIGERMKTIPLEHPFVWEGERVLDVNIRRLTLGEVQVILTRPEGEKLTTYDIYARMTGLPAAVLRGLDDDDGRTVTEAAYDFLPRSLRTGGD